MFLRELNLWLVDIEDFLKILSDLAVIEGERDVFVSLATAAKFLLLVRMLPHEVWML